jgi:hypothetical protein
LAGLEIGVGIRPTGNRNFLAAKAVQTILVEVIPTQATRPSTNPLRDPETHSHHGQCQSHMGSAKGTRRTEELGFKISERTVSRLMPKKTGKPSQTWMTFLRNHVGQMVSVDFFTVPTIQLRVLHVFVILAHDRRRVLHFNVTQHRTADWTARQIVEAFPDDTVPGYLVRDRDGIHGDDFITRVDGLGIRQVPISARSPWQNCYAERIIGSIRRECLNHVIVFNERHLRRILKSYFSYYHRSRTHLSLDKDAPKPRPVQDLQAGRIVQIREVGGLHHRYERQAA